MRRPRARSSLSLRATASSTRPSLGYWLRLDLELRPEVGDPDNSPAARDVKADGLGHCTPACIAARDRTTDHRAQDVATAHEVGIPGHVVHRFLSSLERLERLRPVALAVHRHAVL